MGMILTQEFQFVGREIHEQQFAPGLKNTGRLLQGGRRIVEKVKDLVQHHRIRFPVGKAETEQVALPRTWQWSRWAASSFARA